MKPTKQKQLNLRSAFKNVILKVAKNELLVPIFMLCSSIVIFVMLIV